MDNWSGPCFGHIQRRDWQILKIEKLIICVSLSTETSHNTIIKSWNIHCHERIFTPAESQTQNLRCYWISCNQWTTCLFAVSLLTLGAMYRCPSISFFIGKKIHFWTSNSDLGLVLAIELQNRVSLVIQPSKPFKFDHRAVLVGGFNFLFTIKSLDLKMIITFCSYLRFMSFVRSRICNGELYLLKYFLYYFITIYYVIFMLLCKNNNIRKVK